MAEMFKSPRTTLRKVVAMSPVRPLVLAGLLVALAGCESSSSDAGAPRPDAPPAPTVSPTTCQLAIRSTAGWDRRCGTVQVPVSRKGVTSTTLDVYVEHLVKGKGPTVVYLTGGPGIGLDAYASIGVVDRLLQALGGELVLLEQRGNPRSPGRLTCGAGEAPQACLTRLVADGAHPEAYNTLESADDVADVLRALGRGRAVLWGHSYGSGLAQFVLARHPDLVESAIFEGVSDPITPRPADPVPSRLAILDRFGKWYAGRCAASPECKAAYPGGLAPANDTGALIAALGPDPKATVPLAGGLSVTQEDLQQWFLNGLATYAGMLAFSEFVHAQARVTATDRSAMDTWLSAVGKGDAAAGAAALRGFLDGLNGSTVVATNSVKSCFDLQSFGLDDTCAPLPVDRYTAADFALNLRTSVPALFLHGPLDTQTLPDETDRVKPRFSSVREVTLGACLGHFAFLDGGACVDQVVSAFLSGGDPIAAAACAQVSCDAAPLSTTFAR